MKSICTKKKILDAFEKKINGHRSVYIQFHFSRIFRKHEWDMNFYLVPKENEY